MRDEKSRGRITPTRIVEDLPFQWHILRLPPMRRAGASTAIKNRASSTSTQATLRLRPEENLSPWQWHRSWTHGRNNRLEGRRAPEVVVRSAASHLHKHRRSCPAVEARYAGNVFSWSVLRRIVAWEDAAGRGPTNAWVSVWLILFVHRFRFCNSIHRIYDYVPLISLPASFLPSSTLPSLAYIFLRVFCWIPQDFINLILDRAQTF